MTMTLKEPATIQASYPKPKEKAAHLKVAMMQFYSRMIVQVRNDPNKQYKVGFIQTLEENDITVLYTRTRVVEQCSAGTRLPVRDGSKTVPPWYSKGTAESPELPTGPTGSADYTALLDDNPSSTYDWVWRGDPTDLMTHVYIRLKFHIWLAALDTSAGAPPRSLTPLYEATLSLQREFKVDCGKPVGSRCLIPTWGHILPDRRSPPRFPPRFDYIWTPGVTANTLFVDVPTPIG